MEFKDRVSTNPNRKKLTIKAPNAAGIAVDTEIIADIDFADANVTEAGTELNAANMNKANWRDDKSLEFTPLDSTNLPGQKTDRTQIATKSSGETWLLPPSGKGTPFQIGTGGGSGGSQPTTVGPTASVMYNTETGISVGLLSGKVYRALVTHGGNESVCAYFYNSASSVNMYAPLKLTESTNTQSFIHIYSAGSLKIKVGGNEAILSAVPFQVTVQMLD